MSFEEQVNALILQFEAAARDGISWSEAVTLGGDFVTAAMALTADLKQPGAIKKEIVMRAVGVLFDAIAPRVVLPLPFYLQWMRPFVRPFLRTAVLKAAEGLIETIFKLNFQGLRT